MVVPPPEIEEEKHVVVAVSSLAESMRRRLGAADAYSHLDATPTIHRVHPEVRDQDGDAYDPKFISVGPYHHRKPGLEATERLKWSFLRDLLARSSLREEQLNRYISVMWQHEGRARGLYSSQVDLPRGVFVEMLVLDGCFIIEFLVKRATAKITGPLTASKWNLPLLRRDLLLLENQIPFFVLHALFDSTLFLEPSDFPPANPATSSKKTVVINGNRYELMDLALHYMKQDKLPPNSEMEVRHLLHLYHLCLLGDFDPKKKNKKKALSGADETTRPAVKPLKSLYSVLITLLYFFVSVLLMCKIPGVRRRPVEAGYAGQKKDAPRTIPNAKALWEAGVRFKRREGKRCLLDVSFADGKMEIPFLSIQENTNAEYRNLIAFEQCWASTKDRHFTSFAIFLDNLVDTAEDAALLEESRIMECKLGSNEEVAQFLNKVVKGATLDYDVHYLARLYKEVTEYVEADEHKWRAKLAHDFFSNPWNKLSLIAAVLLLLMTLAQTTLAFLGYLRPPSSGSTIVCFGNTTMPLNCSSTS